jgi:hypothetical protein
VPLPGMVRPWVSVVALAPRRKPSGGALGHNDGHIHIRRQAGKPGPGAEPGAAIRNASRPETEEWLRASRQPILPSRKSVVGPSPTLRAQVGGERHQHHLPQAGLDGNPDLRDHFHVVHVCLKMPAVAGLMQLLPLRASATFFGTLLPPVPRAFRRTSV